MSTVTRHRHSTASYHHSPRLRHHRRLSHADTNERRPSSPNMAVYQPLLRANHGAQWMFSLREPLHRSRSVPSSPSFHRNRKKRAQRKSSSRAYSTTPVHTHIHPPRHSPAYEHTHNVERQIRTYITPLSESTTPRTMHRRVSNRLVQSAPMPLDRRYFPRKVHTVFLYVCTCVYVCVRVCVWYLHILIYTHHNFRMYVCVYVCVCVCVCVCVYIPSPHATEYL